MCEMIEPDNEWSAALLRNGLSILHSVLSGYLLLAYTKTVDSVFCMLWLATQSPDIQCYSLIYLQFLLASDDKFV